MEYTMQMPSAVAAWSTLECAMPQHVSCSPSPFPPPRLQRSARSGLNTTSQAAAWAPTFAIQLVIWRLFAYLLLRCPALCSRRANPVSFSFLNCTLPISAIFYAYRAYRKRNGQQRLEFEPPGPAGSQTVLTGLPAARPRAACKLQVRGSPCMHPWEPRWCMLRFPPPLPPPRSLLCPIWCTLQALGG